MYWKLDSSGSGDLSVRPHPLDSGTAAAEIQQDRQELAVVEGLDPVSIGAEPLGHRPARPRFDLDMDEQSPSVPEWYPGHEIRFAAPAAAVFGQELLVEEGDAVEAQPFRHPRRHEAQEVGKEGAEEALEEPVMGWHGPIGAPQPHRESENGSRFLHSTRKKSEEF